MQSRNVCGTTRFIKAKCLANLISSYYWVTLLMDEGKPVRVVCLDFSKVFDTAQIGTAQHNTTRHGSVQFSTSRHSSARLSRAQHCLARLGTA